MTNLEKYKNIMDLYRNGEYGKDYLSVNEILTKAGEPDLLRKMSLEELDELINSSTGMQRSMLLSIKNKK